MDPDHGAEYFERPKLRMTQVLKNWAGNVAFSASTLDKPTSLDELQMLVANRYRLRAIGTGHSFSRIADSLGALVSLKGLPRTIAVDRERLTATVSAATTYGELAPFLHSQGFAVRNLASLPHISVAGACATGTHGSGDGLGNLATVVSGIEMITGNGDVVVVTRGDNKDQFPGVVVGLGALGIVTRLTLDLVPSFEVCQYVYEDISFTSLCHHLSEIFEGGYSVSVFTRWQPNEGNQIWLKRRVGDKNETPERYWLGATAADGPRHPVAGVSPDVCTEQMGVVGPWYERLPHFRVGCTPSTGMELQSEYFVSRESATDAMAAVGSLGDRISQVLQVSEIRTIASDELWMSPSYGRDSVAFQFTWNCDLSAVTSMISVVEKELAPFGARPHWGKLFCIRPDIVSSMYERIADFRQLIRQYDPAGKFGNEMLDPYLS